MKRVKETDKSENEMPAIKKQEINDESSSQSTSSIACLVCHGHFKTTNNSLIPNLPFCKGCKNTYFSVVANQSNSENSFSSQQGKCPTRGRCIIDYRFSNPKEWCSSCHVRKFQAILRRFDALQVNTRCNQTVEKSHHDPAAEENLDLNPVVLVEKLTNWDLASLGIKAPRASRSQKIVVEENGKHFLPPSKSSPDLLPPHQPFSQKKQFKGNQNWTSCKKTSKTAHEFMRSIDIYVFDCGHACTACNSDEAKKWLKDCGFHTASPSTAEAIHPNTNQCTNNLSLPVEDRQSAGSLSGSASSEHQPEMARPENSGEPQTSSKTLLSFDHSATNSLSSQAECSPGQLFLPVLLPFGFSPQKSNDALLYGSVPIAVQSLGMVTPSPPK